MKKVIVMALAAIIACAPSFAQTKQDIKNAKKEAKKEAKEKKREGYKMLEAGDFQIALQDFLTKTKAGNKQVVGTAEGCISINLAKTTALNNAINEYATMSGGMVKGRITSSVSNIDDVQIDNIVAAYERLVLKTIRGEIQGCITLVKEVKGKYDVVVYCLVDFDAAKLARERAMEMALEELKVSQTYGSQISDWIDEGLNKKYD